MMDKKLEGRTALITGSDSGIGQATAIEFARQGANVVITYLHDKEGAEQTLHKVREAGGEGLVVQVDVSQEAGVEAMFDQAVEKFGEIFILMNNAGIDASGIKVADYYGNLIPNYYEFVVRLLLQQLDHQKI